VYLALRYSVLLLQRNQPGLYSALVVVAHHGKHVFTFVRLYRHDVRRRQLALLSVNLGRAMLGQKHDVLLQAMQYKITELDL
jgi:hypothetical protein